MSDERFVGMVKNHVRFYNVHKIRSWLEGKTTDANLVRWFELWSNGQVGLMVTEMDKLQKKVDTKVSTNPAVRMMDANKDGEISREELAEFREKALQEEKERKDALGNVNE